MPPLSSASTGEDDRSRRFTIGETIREIVLRSRGHILSRILVSGGKSSIYGFEFLPFGYERARLPAELQSRDTDSDLSGV